MTPSALRHHHRVGRQVPEPEPALSEPAAGKTRKSAPRGGRKTAKGPQIVVSRTHPGLIKRLFELEVPEIADGIVERIGDDPSSARVRFGERTVSRSCHVADHDAALRLAFEMLTEAGGDLDTVGLVAVGHRMVHGGRRMYAPTRLDDEAVAIITELSPLAPLHNPPGLHGIEVARRLLTDVCTSFQVDGMAILDMAWRINPDVRVFTVDTGRLPLETYDLMQKVGEAYPAYPIRVYYPDAAALEAYVNENGINAFYNSVEQRKSCCHIRKIEPLKRKLAGVSAWATGQRRDQIAPPAAFALAAAFPHQLDLGQRCRIGCATLGRELFLDPPDQVGQPQQRCRVLAVDGGKPLLTRIELGSDRFAAGNLGQHLARTRRQIVEVADRRGHHIQRRSGGHRRTCNGEPFERRARRMP